MCPVVILALGFTFLLMLLELTAAIQVTFNPGTLFKLSEGDSKYVSVFVNGTYANDLHSATAYSEDDHIADVVSNPVWYFNNTQTGEGNWSFSVTGKFLGFTNIRVRTRMMSKDGLGKIFEKTSDQLLEVSVVRKNSKLSLIFIVSVAILVSLNYINMGCALDLAVVKSVVIRPIAPLIGFFCQFVVMPLVGYGVGQLLFDDHDLQLGLFTFGCSPGGGASNMWTVLLAGNLNLSITLTFISTAAALVMMPFWLFTLGQTLFQASLASIPFRNIVVSLVSMVIPLGIGLLMQKYVPKAANFCRRIIAPASIIMILYIIAFGTYSNLYMFKIMTWRVLVAASLNVWIGFFAGFAASKIFKQENQDTIAIAVETGVQNTGISIVLLGVSLTQPSADLASVVPVAASIVTPIPLLMILIGKRIYGCCFPDKSHRQRYVLDLNQAEDSKHMVYSPPTSYNGTPISSEEKNVIA